MKVPWPPKKPPPSLRNDDQITLPANRIIWRLYFAGGPHGVTWDHFRDYGPTHARFDHHNAISGKPVRQTRAIHYAAADPITPFAEVFQDTRTIDRHTHDPWLVGYRLAQPLTLLNLAGPFITRAGASPAINACDKAKARAWSRYFYQHYKRIDGLVYHASMYAQAEAYALFERATPALPLAPVFNRALADPALYTRLVTVAYDLGFHLV